VIIGFPQIILNKENLTDKGKTYIKNITDAAYRMLNMINLSLDMFKMEKGIYPLNPVPVDVMQVLNNIKIEVEELLKFKNLLLKISISPRPSTEEDIVDIQGEELLCYSMLANLIKNAIEASPDDEIISINVEKNKPTVISIHNKGVVPEEIRDKFFEKFVTAGKVTGTGLVHRTF